MDEPLRDLLDGLDEDQIEALGDLSMVTAQLSALAAPAPTAEEQAGLVAFLTPHLYANAAAPAVPAPTVMKKPDWRAWGQLVLAQIYLFEREFWYACLGILALTLFGGILVGHGALSLFTVVASPLMAAAGVLYVFRSESSSLAQLELASPVDPVALFFCRAGLILGINLAALPLLLLPGQLLFPELSFWRVVLLWLGVLVGLCGVSVYTATRWNGALRIVIPLSIWGLLVGASWQQAAVQAGPNNPILPWIAAYISTSPIPLAASGLAFLAGCLLLVQSARWVKKDNLQWG